MRNLLIIFAILFWGTILFAQEETISYIMNDGNVKTYNLSDIEEICILEKYDEYMMSIFMHNSPTISYAFNQFDSVKYSRDYNNNYVYIVYRGAERDSYLLANIDSIRYDNYIIAESPVQRKLLEFVNYLGLEIKTKSSMDRMADKLDQVQGATNSVIKTGDIVEFGFNDEARNNIFKFKINENESDKNKMVYYGTGENKLTGKINDLRRTISASSTGISVKEELKLGDKYVPRETKEYVSNNDKTVSEYVYDRDGTKSINFVYSPKSPTSIVKTNPYTGEKYVVENISIFQK